MKNDMNALVNKLGKNKQSAISLALFDPKITSKRFWSQMEKIEINEDKRNTKRSEEVFGVRHGSFEVNKTSLGCEAVSL